MNESILPMTVARREFLKSAIKEGTLAKPHTPDETHIQCAFDVFPHEDHRDLAATVVFVIDEDPDENGQRLVLNRMSGAGLLEIGEEEPTQKDRTFAMSVALIDLAFNLIAAQTDEAEFSEDEYLAQICRLIDAAVMVGTADASTRITGSLKNVSAQVGMVLENTSIPEVLEHAQNAAPLVDEILDEVDNGEKSVEDILAEVYRELGQ